MQEGGATIALKGKLALGQMLHLAPIMVHEEMVIWSPGTVDHPIRLPNSPARPPAPMERR